MTEWHTLLYFSILIFKNVYVKSSSDNKFCDIEAKTCKAKEQVRYLLYDVNPPEGFNLRRDVFLRFAVFSYNLQKSTDQNLSKFKLVLPPWSNLYHWKSENVNQIPWSHFFDLESLQRFISVIEMHQFFDEMFAKYSKVKIDDVYILQHFDDMFKTGKFEDKMEIRKCNNKIETNFFCYKNLTSDNVKCLSFHGHATQLSKILAATDAQSILFDHAEIALHDRFGDNIYWKARRSMRFNKGLCRIAAEFREKYLDSIDKLDNSELPENWEDEKPRRSAKGGPYLGVHLRRRDFAWGRPKDVPSIANAATQIKNLLLKLNLNKVFIATDAPAKEYRDLKELLIPNFEVYKFTADKDDDTKEKYREGELAIIDQIICSHARYFVGTHESTFSFRIQEEREIIGFPVETTFNRLCGDEPNYVCEKPSMWKIVY